MVDLSLVVPNSPATQCVKGPSIATYYIQSGYGPGVLRYWTTDARRIAKVIREIRPDIVHIQGAAGWGLWLPMLPTVVTVHGIPHLNAVSKKQSAGMLSGLSARVRGCGTSLVEKVSRRRAGNVIVINEYVLEELPDIRGLTYAMIPNPVHKRYIEGPATGVTVPGTILVAGRIEPAKGILESINIFSRLVQVVPGASLLIAGPVANKKYMEECCRAASEQGVQSKVQFLGQCSPEKMIELYDRASCLLVTSKQETAPVVVSEALTRGVPIAAIPKFGLKTMIQPGINGLFLHPSSCDQQAEIVARAMGMVEHRLSIASLARQLYSPARVARQTAEFYQFVFERHNRARASA
jgi:glycosyltransferase involved in cell wall biosynthesis